MKISHPTLSTFEFADIGKKVLNLVHHVQAYELAFAEGDSDRFFVDDPEVLADVEEILTAKNEKGFDRLASVYLNADKTFSGILEDDISPKITKRYAFKLTGKQLQYRLVNPSSVADFTEAELLEFATATKGKKKQAKCIKGVPCDPICLRPAYVCLHDLTPGQKKVFDKAVRKALDAKLKAEKLKGTDKELDALLNLAKAEKTLEKKTRQVDKARERNQSKATEDKKAPDKTPSSKGIGELDEKDIKKLSQEEIVQGLVVHDKKYHEPLGITFDGSNKQEVVAAMTKASKITPEEAEKSFDAVRLYFSDGELGKFARNRNDLGKPDETVDAVNDYIKKAPPVEGEVYASKSFKKPKELEDYIESLSYGLAEDSMKQFDTIKTPAQRSNQSHDNQLILVVQNKTGVSLKEITNGTRTVLAPKNVTYKLDSSRPPDYEEIEREENSFLGKQPPLKRTTVYVVEAVAADEPDASKKFPTETVAKNNYKLIGKGLEGTVYVDPETNKAFKYFQVDSSISPKTVEGWQLASDLGVGPKFFGYQQIKDEQGQKRAIVSMQYLDGYVTGLPVGGVTDQAYSKDFLKKTKVLHSKDMILEDLHIDNVMSNSTTKDVRFIDINLARKVTWADKASHLLRSNSWGPLTATIVAKRISAIHGNNKEVQEEFKQLVNKVKAEKDAPLTESDYKQIVNKVYELLELE